MIAFPEVSEKTRAYFYRVVVAALPVLVLTGVVDVDEVALWLGLAAAVLATANTSTKPDDAGQSVLVVAVVAAVVCFVLLLALGVVEVR